MNMTQPEANGTKDPAAFEELLGEGVYRRH
jgi:hypothetical protein